MNFLHGEEVEPEDVFPYGIELAFPLTVVQSWFFGLACGILAPDRPEEGAWVRWDTRCCDDGHSETREI